MLLRIAVLIIILLVLPDTYIYNMYVKRWTEKLWIRLSWFVPSAALALAAVVIMASNDMKPEHQASVGVYMIVMLCICAPKMLFTFFDGIGHAIGRALKRDGDKAGNGDTPLFVRIMRIVGMSFGIFSFFVLCYGYFVGRHQYVVHHQTFYFSDLPKEFDGYRIAQFSDMHVGTLHDGNEGDAAKVVTLINEQHCDAILFTGDIVNHQSAELEGFKDDFCRLSAKDGVYAVMGNHDYSMYIHYPDEKEHQDDIAKLQSALRSYGWHLLLNDHKVLRRGKDSLVIAGVENDGRPPFPAYGDLKKTMKGLDSKTCFTILLSHDPTHWRRAIIPDTNIQLTLSGHTHAGQFKIFGWSPVAYVYDEWSGAYSEGGQILNVSDGIGEVMFPFRFGAWPEVNVITLRRGTGK
ncbi:MAG: metallophosphoesterase [Bacteroidaceae bacterium]|nr:metallophosphoesterase [Bacteroidaceae bacterium]